MTDRDAVPPIPRPAALGRLEAAVDHARQASASPGEPLTFSALWDAFAAFLRVPVVDCDPEGDLDMVLIEHYGSPQSFSIDLVRQLSDESSEDMEMLRLDLTFSSTPALAAIAGSSDWIAPFDDAGLRRVAQDHPAIKELLRSNPRASSVEIWRDEVG